MTTSKDRPVRRLPAHKLMLSYLSVIMVMSILFSSVFYITSVRVLDRRLSDTAGTPRLVDSDHALDEWIGRRSDDGRADLSIHLLGLNLGALVGGTILSYWLARRTLLPIERSLSEQDQFIADASHELRTPITSALLSNEIALKNPRLTIAEARTILKGNVTDMQELKTLTDELLYESGEGRETIQIRMTDLQQVIHDAVAQVHTIAVQKHVRIVDESTPSTASTDAKQLRKIVVILLENAVKYSMPESVVTIRTEATRSGYKLTVIDHGVGIAQTDVKHIFNRFYRADHSRSETAGYGLGLSIAQKISREIGVSLSVRSTLAKGSEFMVDVPLKHQANE